MAKVQPITFEELAERLERLNIIADTSCFGGVKVFREYRMGLGTDKFYSVAFHASSALVYPPTIMKVLEHFGIPLAEWDAGEESGDVIGRVAG